MPLYKCKNANIQPHLSKCRFLKHISFIMASNDFTDSEMESGTEDSVPQYTQTSVTTIHHPVAKGDRSSVLKFFDKSNLRRQCKICKKAVGVGRQPNKPATGNLISHMKRYHPTEWYISRTRLHLEEWNIFVIASRIRNLQV